VDRLRTASQPLLLASFIRRVAPSVSDYWMEEAVGEMAVQLVDQESRGAPMRDMGYVAIDALRVVTDMTRGSGEYRSVPIEYPERIATMPDVYVREALRERLAEEESEAEWRGLDERTRAARRMEGLCAVTLFPFWDMEEFECP